MQVTSVSGQISKMTRAQELGGLAGRLLVLFQAFRGVRTTERKQMRLLETLPLGGKQHLLLVECAGERYLVGGSPESIQTIVPMTRQTAFGGIAEYQ
jgi:flagellar biogenesis protein FliO